MKFNNLSIQFIAWIASLMIVVSKSKFNFNYYTRTIEMDKKMSDLSQKNSDLIKEHSLNEIKGLKDTYSKDKSTLFKYYDIGTNTGNKNKEKVFLMSGEHPREMIAVETMYNFIEDLITNKEQYKKILDNYLIRIVLISNPYARIRVEKGEYCRRLNPNDVDINRNWDIHWAKSILWGEENPGKKPFSEIETQFLKKVLENYHPKIFLAMHSGIYGLYMPFAYEKREAVRNGKVMKESLIEIKDKFCKMCQVGAPSMHIGYKSSGTGMDYAHEKLKIPYSFVWEVYTDEQNNPELEEFRSKFAAKSEKIIKRKNLKSFLELSYSSETIAEKYKFLNKRRFEKSENNMCVSMFNPTDELGVKYIKNNWTKALSHFLENFIGK